MSKSRSFKNLYADAKAFFQEELWVKDLSALPRVRQLLFALCRVVMIVIRGFKDDQCSLQASALTYITLVSLVPMLAIMFSFSKGLGMQKRVLDKIGVERYQVEDASARDGVTWQYRVISNSNAPAADGGGTVTPPKKAGASAPGVVAGEQANASGLAQRLPEPMQKALVTVFNYVENTSFAALGLIGLLLLLFSVIGSMARLEESFNKIWGVKRGRPFLRKLSEYLVVLILLPVIFLIATSVNTLLLSNQFYTYLHEHVRFDDWLIEKLGAQCGVA